MEPEARDPSTDQSKPGHLAVVQDLGEVAEKE
jgi:hypothetical protein